MVTYKICLRILRHFGTSFSNVTGVKAIEYTRKVKQSATEALDGYVITDVYLTPGLKHYCAIFFV